MKLSSKLLVCALAVLLFVPKGEARKVWVGVPTLSMVVIAFTAAEEKRFYKEEDLDVELVWMSAPAAAQALIGGNVEFSTVSGSAIPAIIGGAPLRFIFTSYNRPMFWLFSKPEIADVRALKGRKIGVSGIGSGPATLLIEILKRNGLDGGRDAAILSLGRMPDIAAGLFSGAVDAAMIAPPFHVTAQEAGFRELVSFLKEDFVELQGSIVIREELLKSDPLLLERFVRGTLKGLTYAREQRSGTIPILARYLKIKEDQAAKYYDSVRPVMTADGTVSEDQLQKFLQVAAQRLRAKETLPLEKVFDYSVTKKIYAELRAKGWRPKP